MYSYQYPRPSVTTDVVVFRTVAPYTTEVLLIKRRNEPYADQMALVGGFLEENETLRDCAIRELFEESSLQISPDSIKMVGTFDAVNRDPRGRTITVAYMVHVNKDVVVKAGDDAKDFQWVPISEIFAKKNVAFDHFNIISDAYQLFGRIYWNLV